VEKFVQRKFVVYCPHCGKSVDDIAEQKERYHAVNRERYADLARCKIEAYCGYMDGSSVSDLAEKYVRSKTTITMWISEIHSRRRWNRKDKSIVELDRYPYIVETGKSLSFMTLPKRG